MNHFKQHRLGDHSDALIEFDFETMTDLLSHQWVSGWVDDGYTLQISDHETLMAVSVDGNEWWVIGYVSQPLGFLPTWQPKFKIGDRVRWVTDVDKVYSDFTKTFVGKVGTLVDPKTRGRASTYVNEPDCLDIVFDSPETDSGTFRVWDIHVSKMEAVE